MNEITKLREDINKIDENIKKLLEKRKKVAEKIGDYKRKMGLKITDKEREKNILSKIEDPYTKNIYKTIIEESKKLQKGL
ncbi:chorismate mutase [Patescibacteria group bacterium]|nr:chorismate mutase [Patescibacteria group bacterium]